MTDPVAAPAPEPLTAASRLYLVDGSAYIFRAYHALPPLTRKSDGLPVGALSGFCNMLWKLLADIGDPAIRAMGAPTHFAVIFDHSAHTFRNDLYKAYKANRDAPPEDLIPQFALIREAVRAFGLPCIEMPGFEADDLIATYTRQAEAAGAETVIMSSDKDLMQLVSDKTTMFDSMKSKRIGRAEVIEKFGLGPEKVIEIQALAGDSADNVPGVPGIGVKTAALLLEEFGDLETLLAEAATIKQKKRRENLLEFAAEARLSRTLVTLREDVPDTVPAATFAMTPVDHVSLVAFLDKMELSGLTGRVRAASGSTPSGGAGGAASGGAASGPGAPVAADTSREGVDAPMDRGAYEVIFDRARLEAWVQMARARGVVAVDTETTGLDAMAAALVGISLAVEGGRACYIPLTHENTDMLTPDENIARQVPVAVALEVLKPLLEDESVLKVGQNIKYDAIILAQAGVGIAPVDDTMLMSYALDCGLHGHGMDELSKLFLGHTPIAFKEIAGTGKAQKTFNQLAIDVAAPYAAEDADITFRLHTLLSRRVISEAKKNLYETLERPLIPVVRDMERAGVKIDPAVLSGLSRDFEQRMAGHEAAAHEAAGEEFNLGSPKQITEIMFGKLGLPGGKKTAKGAWSTKADVLEGLAAAGHDLPKALLAWRSLAKLKSTYTDTLPTQINAKTGRVHTSYSLASTTTGRLSSNDPNLQNIPIRTEDGRKIRTAFIAEEGNVLISADYSQVELRLLAHIARIDSMKQAFADGVDIHAMTASEMFGVPLDGMDASVRRSAKAINFGIIYGISAFGLANQLGISRGEAKAYIDDYFAKFPGIRRYMDETVASAKSRGFVETVFGRYCHTPNITAKIPAQRGYAERQAINAPIQGAAADVIRRAMIRMPAALARAGLSARMLLQVHDELVFECPEAEAGEAAKVIEEVMAQAPLPAIALDVPLIVEAGTGLNWDEAH